MSEKKSPNGNGVSRRDFFKIGAIVGAGLQVVGVAGTGYVAGKTYNSYTGWRDFEGEQQVNRKGWEIDGPAYKKVGTPVRPNKATDFIFPRFGMLTGKFKGGWRPDQGIDALGEPLASFYNNDKVSFEVDVKLFTEILPKAAKDHKKYDDYFALADAFAEGWADIFPYYPPEPTAPPEDSDFHYIKFSPYGAKKKKIREPMPFKSEEHAAALIKKTAHLYGATIVGITKLNPDWCYDRDLRGGKPMAPFEVPKHWKYAICVGVPHEWDQVLSNPAHGTSYDGYNRVRNCSGRLANFIKHLGYPARSHHPPAMYDLIVPPISVDAGMGELARMGFVITPETGANLRTAVVTTSLPMTVDKPIEFGVKEFCRKCKICADNCPSEAISFADSEEGMHLRGYEHWHIQSSKCYAFWMQAMGPLGCRLCLAVCPFTRKGNYAHKVSKFVDRNDPTGLVSSVLIWMQKTMFKSPDVQEYLPPPDGRFAGLREAPTWLQVEDWFDMDVKNPQKGE